MIEKVFNPNFSGIRIGLRYGNAFIGFAQFDKILGVAKCTGANVWDITQSTAASWWTSRLLATVSLSAGRLTETDLAAFREAIVEFMDARYEFIAAILESKEIKRGKK